MQTVNRVQSNPVVQKAETNVSKVTNNSAVSRGVSNAGNTLKTISSKINVSADSLNHVFERHVEGGIKANGASIFSNPTEITDLVDKAQEIEPILQKNGNLRRIVDAGKIIGTDVRTGQETSLYTVITNYNVITQTENLVTTHPGLPR